MPMSEKGRYYFEKYGKYVPKKSDLEKNEQELIPMLCNELRNNVALDTALGKHGITKRRYLAWRKAGLNDLDDGRDTCYARFVVAVDGVFAEKSALCYGKIEEAIDAGDVQSAWKLLKILNPESMQEKQQIEVKTTKEVTHKFYEEAKALSPEERQKRIRQYSNQNAPAEAQDTIEIENGTFQPTES